MSYQLKHPNKNFFSLDTHPLVQHKLTLMRDKNTSSKEFRESLEELTFILASESLKNLKFTSKTVYTPLAKFDGIKINTVTLIPILRAGLSMMSPLQRLLPDCKVGFMGLARDEETLQPIEYYSNIPIIEKNETAIILDPMLATGNTVAHTLKYLLDKKVENIIVISILATPKALDTIFNAYPNCLIYSAGYDEKLNANGYIVPGLGDAGDRIFNTLK